MTDRAAQPRTILALAVPAFLALVAEPLFLLVDSAVIGHLGTTPLAALGLASAVLIAAANLFVFLAYGTTSIVARQLGGGSRRSAIEAGLDGVWLAAGIGLIVAILLAIFAGPLVAMLGGDQATTSPATTYLKISALGLPGMLLVLAGTGVLRGLHDTKTPLILSAIGFSANAALNILFVIGLGWGIAGAAWGTVIAQWGMAAGLLTVIARGAAAQGAMARFQPARVLHAAATGVPLLIRTVALRAVLILTVMAAARMGQVTLAAHQVAFSIWTLLAFALDALAIAAQALTGTSLGSGDRAATRATTALMLRWGVWCGVAAGLLLLCARPWLPGLFTADPAVAHALSAALIVMALSQPISGYVFVADGVLIGAGDGLWLAKAMVAVLVIYVPVLALISAHNSGSDPSRGLVALWLALTVFMGARLAFFAYRIRQDHWMVTGT